VDASIRNEGLIREVLDHACEHSEIVIISTPYMRFESSFLRLEEGLVHCHANMDLEDAKYGLRSPELKIRFPHAEHFYEGATKLLGLGRAKGRPSLQLGIPITLEDGDYRRAYRAERIGRVPVTFSTRKYELLMGSLINISTTGLRLFLNRTYEEDELLVDDMIHVAFTVGGTIYINTKVKVRYIKEKVFGAEFRPPLDGQLLEDLARWVFQKREEDLLAMGRSAGQGETVPSGEVRGSAALVLVSSSNELGDQLSALLASDLPPLRRLPQTIQSARDLASAGPALVLFHVDSTSWETRRRLKALAEALPATLPIVALGTGVDSGQLAELGTEIRAVWSYPLQPTPGSIFPRLLRGIFRKHFPD
jgi:hypothetical protein